ncbi:protein phosphatase 2C domain-containing protein [Aestuariivirga sp.]|uniref:protein phosphatase 2C domain-containing protein n=1 Tax=Aestuariivirga sp. TaxID=2650926 RepID=UPI00359333B6
MKKSGEAMRLLGSVTQGSGAVNEDGFGVVGATEISSAWIFDGVTGINARNYLPAATDAQWLVTRAHKHLLELAGQDIALPDLLSRLVEAVVTDWKAASAGLDLPPNYDPPAACLILAKRYGDGWKALRLGDSCLLARDSDRSHRIFVASPNNAFDNWLSREARKRRDAGVLDIKALLAEFRPQLQAGRAKRNQPDGYSILECSEASLAMPEYIDLGHPAEILLCTDGYYRAVDHYEMCDDASLLDASAASVGKVLEKLRAIEATDHDCQRFLRFKPADDATAVMLALQTEEQDQ